MATPSAAMASAEGARAVPWPSSTTSASSAPAEDHRRLPRRAGVVEPGRRLRVTRREAATRDLRHDTPRRPTLRTAPGDGRRGAATWGVVFRGPITRAGDGEGTAGRVA